MRIFVLGVGGAGSLLAQLLVRQGHTVWCGDRDPDRARKFLGKKSAIEVRIQIQVMRTQTQRRAQNNFVEDGGGSVDQ